MHHRFILGLTNRATAASWSPFSRFSHDRSIYIAIVALGGKSYTYNRILTRVGHFPSHLMDVRSIKSRRAEQQCIQPKNNFQRVRCEFGWTGWPCLCPNWTLPMRARTCISISCARAALLTQMSWVGEFGKLHRPTILEPMIAS